MFDTLGQVSKLCFDTLSLFCVEVGPARIIGDNFDFYDGIVHMIGLVSVFFNAEQTDETYAAHPVTRQTRSGVSAISRKKEITASMSRSIAREKMGMSDLASAPCFQ